jgi:hypothetical protein
MAITTIDPPPDAIDGPDLTGVDEPPGWIGALR